MTPLRWLPLVLLGACASVGPDYKRPAMELPAHYPEDSPAEGAALAPDWWRLYADATLDELVASGQKTNADLRLAAARVQTVIGMVIFASK